MKTCDKCMKHDICGKREVFGAVGCADDFQQKPQTNADKIRSMNDDELADWIVKHDNKTNENGYWTRGMILEYMKSEVENGN